MLVCGANLSIPAEAAGVGSAAWYHYLSGNLYLTDRRLIFCPNLLDALRNRTWFVSHRDIARVGVEPRGGDIFAGGLRERLRVDLRGGDTRLFVVNGLHDKVALLQRTVSASRQPGP